MAPALIMHVNYGEQGQSLAEICRRAVAFGFDGVEFRRRRAQVAESPEEYLDGLARAVEAAGLRHVLFGGPGADLMTPDAGRRQAEVEDLGAFFRLAARRFPLTVLNVMSGNLRNPAPDVPYGDCDRHGSAIATDDHWRWAADGFRALGAVAAELGFRLAFETHMVYLHDTPAAARRLADLVGSPAVGVNLDYGNAVEFRRPPALAEAIDQVGDRLYYVHLKNSLALPDGGCVTVGLGDGTINHREYLRRLKERGYAGPICLEAPRDGDREWYAKQDLAYVRSVLADLDW